MKIVIKIPNKKYGTYLASHLKKEHPKVRKLLSIKK
jgi:hypothetical protein